MNYIKYTGGYKYQLKEDYTLQVSIKPSNNVLTEFLELYTDGDLLIKRGYAWDGPSGPTVDTKTFMRGSLVHDALYQLIRLELIDRIYKDHADRLLRRICIDDGMWKLRAWWVFEAVQKFGHKSIHPDNVRKVYTAP